MKYIWQTHRLRWLYYRRIPNMQIGKHIESNERCSNCKKGVGSKFGMLYWEEDGTKKYISYCPHCRKEFKSEKNTNISKKLYTIYKKITKFFWYILDRLHLVRTCTDGRYGMFGDESHYVRGYSYNLDWVEEKRIMRERKWWEYIIIKNK